MVFGAEKLGLGTKPEMIVQRMDDQTAEEIISRKIDVKTILGKIVNYEIFTSPVIESLARLVFELRENLLTYDTLISEDAGGRLPSLVLQKLINQERKKQGKETTSIYFISGGHIRSPETEEAVTTFINNKKESLKKTLLVTEYIASGKSIRWLIETLEKHHIDFDVATVSIDLEPTNQDYSKELRDEFKKRLHYGSIGRSGLTFYGKHSTSGVSRSYQDKFSPHPGRYRDRDRNPKQVVSVREDVTIIAKELSKLLE